MNKFVDEKCCQVFQALSDPTRLQILNDLKKHEKCVSAICRSFEITQPSVSHHLDILKRAGLVKSRKIGREVHYSYNGDMIIECCGMQFKALDILIRKK